MTKRFTLTLFSRLMLIWLLGMLAVLTVSFILISGERNRVGRAALYQGAAQEIATAVEMLDRISPNDRRGWIQEPGKHGFRLSMEPPPPRARPRQDHIFYRMLNEALPDRNVQLFEHSRPRHGHPLLIATVTMSDNSVLTMRLPTIPAAPPPPQTSFDQVLASLIALLTGIALLSWFAVRVATRPLSNLAAAARALGEDPERPPLDTSGPQEVAQAASAFNQMQKRIQGHMAERTRILAAISHDLQTPITRLRLRAEMVEDDSLRERIQADLDNMQSLIREGLDYARSMDASDAPQPIDLNDLLSVLCNDARDMGWAVSCTGQMSTPSLGHPRALQRALWNLIENGVKFGEKVDITLLEHPDHHEIRVHDFGPGLPQEELEKVFEPFYRTESSRNRETGGTGLGLAIVRNLLRAQRGSIHLTNCPDGGLLATVTLPKN